MEVMCGSGPYFPAFEGFLAQTCPQYYEFGERNMKTIPIIGFYGYWVWLTYLSVAAAITGISFALSGRPGTAVICLIASGVCDMFDGSVARTAKRTDMEKGYGIQIDSLADVISFGVLPAAIGYSLYHQSGSHTLPGTVATVAILSLYVLCALIRLAYFNVTEEEMRAKGQKRTGYVGLPVTTASLILSVIYAFIADLENVSTVYTGLLLVLAIAFVSKFTIPKFKLKYMVILAFVGLGVILLALYFRGVI